MLRVVVIVLVFVGAIFVFSSRQPEQIFARSADGVVTLEGVSRTVRSVRIEMDDSPFAEGLSVEPGLSSHYFISLDAQDSGFSPQVTIQILEQWKQNVDDPSELKIFIFRDELHEWQSLPTDVDLSRGTLHAQINLSEFVWIAVDEVLRVRCYDCD